MAEWKSFSAVYYCLISFALSIIFVAGVLRIDALRVDSTTKGVGLGILSVEIMSQPMLAAADIILQMTASQTAHWVVMSFVMHLVYNIFNLFLLLVVNPLAAILLIELGVSFLTGKILPKQSENQSSFLVLGKSLGDLEYENLTTIG